MVHRVREPLCVPNFYVFCIVYRIASRPMVKFVDSKSALKPTVVSTTERYMAVVLV